MMQIEEPAQPAIAKCPYNQAHVMPANRLQFHLARGCKDKLLKAHLFTHCPYNFLHIIPNDVPTHTDSVKEINEHKAQCRDRMKGQVNTNSFAQFQESKFEWWQIEDSLELPEDIAANIEKMKIF